MLSKKKKKACKLHIDWMSIIINALADLAVGILLLIADKHIK